MIHKDFSYCFKFNQYEWQQVQEDQCYSEFPQERNLKIGTYNVLFGMPNKILNIYSRNQKRFTYIIENIIAKTDPDILSLMEVTQEFMDILLSNPYIRQNYYVSHVSKMYQRRLFEVVIISKQPFYTIYLQDARQGRYQFSLFQNFEVQKSFILISTHLWAGEGDFKSRQKQLSLINQTILDRNFLNSRHINPTIKNKANIALENNNIILQGDLNLHMRHEDQYIYENGFIDAYREIYPFEAGYTWDSTKNNFINSVFKFDNRRMRLDRILIRQNCNLFQVQDVKILGQEKIGIGLCASDHYLLLSVLKMNKNPQILVQQYDTSNIVLEQSTGFRTIQNIIKIRIAVLFGIIFFIILLAVGIPLLVIYK
ncbi:hypothetical protein ABPG74_015135 [Tetrahymena malaccensis]